MSKRRWKDICSLSSFRVSLLDKANLPDELTTNAGGIDPSYFPDSNIFNINTFAVEAGFTDAYDFKRRILTSSVWHAHQVPMRDDDGRLLGVLVATHVDSARAGREIWDTKKKSEQRERGCSMNFWTKKSNAFQAGTNVSSFRG